MSNRATQNRDLGIARLLEQGTVRTWADGSGTWHARVPVAFTHPHNLARYAIRLVLQERAPRGAYVDPPTITLVETDEVHHHYQEGTT